MSEKRKGGPGVVVYDSQGGPEGQSYDLYGGDEPPRRGCFLFSVALVVTLPLALAGLAALA